MTMVVYESKKTDSGTMCHCVNGDVWRSPQAEGRGVYVFMHDELSLCKPIIFEPREVESRAILHVHKGEQDYLSSLERHEPKNRTSADRPSTRAPLYRSAAFVKIA